MYAMHLMLTVTIVYWGGLDQSCDSVAWNLIGPPQRRGGAYVSQTIQAWSEAGRTTGSALVSDSIDVNLCWNSESRANQKNRQKAVLLSIHTICDG
jgi:hypothetical protein